MKLKRYILTGTPGSGKTSIIQALEMQGAQVVHEAATDVIACQRREGCLIPWEKAVFIDEILHLQQQREDVPNRDHAGVIFYDRSPICTYALAQYLGFEPSTFLLAEIERIQNDCVYENQVFFIENLGFITNTEARQINFEEALKFEKLHLDVYKELGYECIRIPPVSIKERIEIIWRSLDAMKRNQG